MNPICQLVIHTHGGRNELNSLLNSLKNFNDERIEIILSNNHKDKIPRINQFKTKNFYHRKCPNHTAIGHFNHSITKCDRKYLILFHDDDIISTHQLSQALDLLQTDLSAYSAIAFNSGRIRNNIHYLSWDMIRIKKDIKLNLQNYLKSVTNVYSRKQILVSFLALNMANINGINFESDSPLGKYQDVSFISKLLMCAPIYYSTINIGLYRFHSNNDSKSSDIKSRIALLEFLKLTNNTIRTIDIHILLAYIFFFENKGRLRILEQIFKSNMIFQTNLVWLLYGLAINVYHFLRDKIKSYL